MLQTTAQNPFFLFAQSCSFFLPCCYVCFVIGRLNNNNFVISMQASGGTKKGPSISLKHSKIKVLYYK